MQLTLLLALHVAAFPAPSASEQRYLDARAAANIRCADGGMEKDQDRARAELASQLRAIIGPVRLAGIQGPGAPAYDGFWGVGSTEMADGLLFKWQSSTLFVTTRALFAHTVATTKSFDYRTVDEVLVSATVIGDAAYTSFTEVPVRHGPSTQRARASVGLVAQDIGPWPPATLVVQVERGNRIYVVSTDLSPGLEQITACEAKWGPRREDAAFDAYRRCVGAALPTRPSFAAVVRRAQAIVDALQQDDPPGSP
ncbi:hypothetical protein [Anaeromyxobacter oryzae]|uniref:Uncharacterized protein n=1 Tax=Anaeromyxobacter oryzae TaxID=2918170 RepID=A0ABM7WQ20_9BACT|nr:hypothetical protein [Anaeromyxobacter oryzae]BDG01550.1 hypothetical protein AMOR_05460 [Anaeromyxobacter oryzae]